MISRRLPIPNPSHDRGAGGFLFCALCSWGASVVGSAYTRKVSRMTERGDQ